MSLPRDAAIGIGFLFVATVIGGFLGGFADVFVGGAILGTPLGPNSALAPVVWTVIAGVLLYGAKGVIA